MTTKHRNRWTNQLYKWRGLTSHPTDHLLSPKNLRNSKLRQKRRRNRPTRTRLVNWRNSTRVNNVTEMELERLHTLYECLSDYTRYHLLINKTVPLPLVTYQSTLMKGSRSRQYRYIGIFSLSLFQYSPVWRLESSLNLTWTTMVPSVHKRLPRRRHRSFKSPFI